MNELINQTRKNPGNWDMEMHDLRSSGKLRAKTLETCKATFYRFRQELEVISSIIEWPGVTNLLLVIQRLRTRWELTLTRHRSYWQASSDGPNPEDSPRLAEACWVPGRCDLSTHIDHWIWDFSEGWDWRHRPGALVDVIGWAYFRVRRHCVCRRPKSQGIHCWRKRKLSIMDAANL